MNRKGFTIIEVLVVIVLVSLVLVVSVVGIRSSMSLGQEEAYKLMKNNIVSVSYDYIQECRQGLISCDFSFNEEVSFSASVLVKSGYFKTIESPIDGRDLSGCLWLHSEVSNGVTVVDLEDKCY